ncbi:hypothetical protein [Streptomyces mirabilis]
MAATASTSTSDSRVSGVSMNPGGTWFTVMPLSMYSNASALVRQMHEGLVDADSGVVDEDGAGAEFVAGRAAATATAPDSPLDRLSPSIDVEGETITCKHLVPSAPVDHDDPELVQSR